MLLQVNGKDRKVVAPASRTLLEVLREDLDLTGTKLTPAAQTERLQYCMPKPFARLLKLGVDLRAQPVEVAPGAHYNLGGIRMDAWGRTGVPGLLACGVLLLRGRSGARA